MDVDALADGTPFMVMEFLEGHDLNSELTDRQRLPVEEAVGFVLEACVAVAEAHALGIVHRDLKPQNLFLAEEGDKRRLKLLDFGISKAADGEASFTITGSSLGTPLYMSPEQIRSAKRVDARSDIWSLGVILYELVTGVTPFVAESPSAVIAAITADSVTPPHEVQADVPAALSAAIMKALEKDPDRRFQSVTELAAALEPFAPPWAATPLVRSPSNPRTAPGVTDAPTVLVARAPGCWSRKRSPSRAVASSTSTHSCSPRAPAASWW